MRKALSILSMTLSIIVILIWCNCYPYFQSNQNDQSGFNVLDESDSVRASVLNPPQNLMVPPLGYDDSSVTIIWSKADDYSAASSYNVYRNGVLLANTTTLFYNATGLTANTSYSFIVRAKASDGTESIDSNTVNQTTKPAITVFNVLNYGAVGNGTTKDTAAIQAAITACTSGGKVLIPSGKTFLSGAIFLKSNMTLQVDGTLRGSDSAADYPKTSMRFPYYLSGNNYMGLINAYTTTYYSMTNVRISGTGTVNGASNTVGSITGHGLTVLGTAEAADDSDRADMVTVKGVDGIYIGGLTFVNPAMHTIFISYSKNITVNSVTANTYDIHNADGINLCTSDTAYVFGSTFDTGDDCINFNAGSGAEGVADGYTMNNARIFNNTLKRGHGGVVFGSFTASLIQNVLIENCTFDGTEIGLRFKTGNNNGGGARNVTARDLTIKNINKDSAIFLDSTYNSTYTSAGPGQFHDITVKNAVCTTITKYGIYVNGLSNARHYNLIMDNISISGAASGGVYLNQNETSTYNLITITGGGTAWTITNTNSNTYTNCNPAP